MEIIDNHYPIVPQPVNPFVSQRLLMYPVKGRELARFQVNDTQTFDAD